MAKDIVIETDGTAVDYSGVKRIQTHSVEGDNVLWMPMDETVTGTRKIKKNGTYKAKDDGFYGYSKVVVDASKKAVGKKQDGKTYEVDVDDQGNLVETVIPDRIKITTNPTKTQYENGENIDLTGAVVKAYIDANTVWNADGYSGGVIPLSELTPNPSKAIFSGEGDEYSDNDGINAVAIPIMAQYSYRDRAGIPLQYLWGTPYFYVYNNSGNYVKAGIGYKVDASGFTKVFLTKYSGHIYWAFDSNNYVNEEHFYEYNIDDENAKSIGGATVFNAGLFSVSSHLSDQETFLINIPESTADPIGKNHNTLSPIGGSQEITVEWYRPQDEEKLTDTFNISVS